ncbi:MAG: hypothetical protein PHH68_03935 [Candidatus Omnitrophica bacterium]|jgi:hypothetical protein|nr:hypothetical protein [Candidatus Omnitrophota bacterium]MDD5079458.1 hypothetical protein [Candidatus Omnitrophota bacterium]
MLTFAYYNLKYQKHPIDNWIVVKGEIRNEGSANFNLAVFRVLLSAGQQVFGSAILKVAGFRARTTKPFEVMIDGAHYEMIPKITKCEILFESAH